MPPSVSPENSALLKAQLLARALERADSEGWDAGLLGRAAEDLGQPPVLAWGLFPNGIPDALETWSRWVDQQMEERLKALPLSEMKVRERIFWGVRIRLECLAPHKDAARHAMEFSLKAPLKTHPFGHIAHIAHDIWVIAGDRSTDWNYYSKRILLSGIYSATFLFWLKDGSPNHEETWGFLEKRISQVLQIPQYTQKLKAPFEKGFEFLRHTLKTWREKE